jgi:hypothetical protein
MKHFIAFTFILFFFYSTMAGEKKKQPAKYPVEIVYLGLSQKQPVYAISNVSNDSQPLLIVVKDEFGERLFEQTLSTKEMTIKLQFDILELGNTAVVIEAYSSNGILQFSSKMMPSLF